ncbi:hypothetical protein [Dickeya dianthicola]|uniref:hypothetical protein n=1 Tax=Dickeya dianthicola TaxID=204039 RepID=UPI001F60F560|nr:hypothetical protein [Dickeya dianthicola]
MSDILKKLPWKTLLVIAAVAFALRLLYLQGYKQGSTTASADAEKVLAAQKSASDAALASLQADYAQHEAQRVEQEKNALLAWQQRYQQQVQAANDAEREYLTTTATLRAQNADLKRRINDVTERWIDARGQAHPVQCVFTAGFVQQYNAAFGIAAGTGTAAITGGAGDPTTTAGPVDRWLRDSGVTQHDVLAHSTDAGERYQQLVAQVNGLLDYIKALQNRKGK